MKLSDFKFRASEPLERTLHLIHPTDMIRASYEYVREKWLHIESARQETTSCSSLDVALISMPGDHPLHANPPVCTYNTSKPIG